METCWRAYARQKLPESQNLKLSKGRLVQGHRMDCLRDSRHRLSSFEISRHWRAKSTTPCGILTLIGRSASSLCLLTPITDCLTWLPPIADTDCEACFSLAFICLWDDSCDEDLPSILEVLHALPSIMLVLQSPREVRKYDGGRIKNINYRGGKGENRLTRRLGWQGALYTFNYGCC